ncbi:hypothetical protein PoB_001835800 [Plakobranchus ocellatus]|uniref:Uncharacterized protein n=1 Tax=Plakobranchus ocellatus TaxID=259542 RepID=A0AAV3ZBQ4_9GAST|nr:hypothetical protein PoB_001835800 [Plakobranchus ocellatus]
MQPHFWMSPFGSFRSFLILHSPSESGVIFKEILPKLQCTMTQKASVNDQGQEWLKDGSEIAFLHSAAAPHFLLGLSQS